MVRRVPIEGGVGDHGVTRLMHAPSHALSDGFEAFIQRGGGRVIKDCAVPASL